jgi:fatty acid desaturase
MASAHMRVAAFTAVNARVRPWVTLENVLNGATAAFVVVRGSPGLQAAFCMAVLLQFTMNAWASHIPHRAPRWLLELSSLFAWTGSPVVLSLVYHLEHHAHPRVPCAELRPNLDLHSPLLEANKARAAPLPWTQLQPELRPRPRRLRGMA